MIGNDIVDLAQARRESNWRRKGFLNKVFTPHEQKLIHSSSDPDVLVWTLWSMKESAYKLIVRETGQRFFAPQKLLCHISESASETTEGSVFYQRTYQTTSISTTHYVATVACVGNEAQAFTQVIVGFDHPGYQHQSTVIREKINQHCIASFSDSESIIQIQKNKAGVPTLLISSFDGQTIRRPISLSHHGYYGAFVLVPFPN